MWLVISKIKTFDRKWSLLLSMFLLAVFGYASLVLVERFYSIDEQLLQDSQFSGDGSHWQGLGSPAVSVEDAHVRIHHDLSQSQYVVQKVAITSPVYVRLTVIAGGEGIVPGVESYAGGASTLIFYDMDGELVEQFPVTGQITGTVPVEEYSLTRHANAAVKEVAVTVRLLDARGLFSVAMPKLETLAQSKLYSSLRFLIFVSWVVFVVAAFFLMLSRLTAIEILAVGLIAVITLLGMLLSPSLAGQILEKLIWILQKVFGSLVVGFFESLWIRFTGLAGQTDFSVLSHFLIFFGIGVYKGFYFKRLGTSFILVGLVVFAITTESLQVLVEDRSPGFTDFAVNLIGGGCGALVGWVCCLSLRQLDLKSND